MTQEFWHNLSPGLVDTLKTFGLAVKNFGRNKIHIRRDLDLDISANNNFQKLKYFGLVAKYKQGGIHVAGFWVLTRNGAAFLRNEIEMPKKVKTCDNRLIEKSLETVRITDYFKCYGQDYWQQTFGQLRIEEFQESLF